MPKKDNLIGKKFGKLTVIEPCENIKGRTAWVCKCDCGNTIKVISKSLKNGNTKSCGCLHKEVINKLFSKDLTNQRFGKLTAIEPTPERKHGSVVWKCQCDCGNIHYVTAELLLSGNAKSCGCLRSKGNAKIKQILSENNVLFVPEYPIRDNNINYYFDFAIMNNNNTIKCLIEYDGILHFKQDSYHGWNNEINWEKTHKNDLIKNNWCKKNNIPLIRIKYTDYDKLTFNYILERINEVCNIVDI